jgi:two-component system NtrC family sensor kinase
VVTSLALAVWGGMAFLALRAQAAHQEDVVASVVALLSDNVRSSTHEHMLHDRREDAYATMRAIARGEGVEKVRVFNKEGTITFSTEPGETGRVVDKRAESCFACHDSDRPLTRLTVGKRTRIYAARDAHRVLGMVTPVYNEPGCANGGCHAHAASQRVLGVLDVGISLRAIDADFARLRRNTGWALGSGLALVAIGVALFTRKMIVRPVDELVEGTRRIGSGDLEHRLPVRANDELGQMAESFNAMTVSLLAARREIQSLLDGLEHKVEERTAALKKAQRDVAESAKLASLGRLAASVAHEINNPLAGILTFARLLLRLLGEGELDAAARESCLNNLRLVERETQRCAQIVKNLLAFARERPLSLESVRVNAVVEEALSLIEQRIKTKGLCLDKRLGELPPVRGDFGQLRQAVLNIAVNACDALDRGGRLSVATRPTTLPPGVEIAIEDEGAGIASEHLEHIFEPFFTTKQTGTGLGLSVAYGIVQRHGGTLDVESALGRGTRFRLALPEAGPQGGADG